MVRDALVSELIYFLLITGLDLAERGRVGAFGKALASPSVVKCSFSFCLAELKRAGPALLRFLCTLRGTMDTHVTPLPHRLTCSQSQ